MPVPPSYGQPPPQQPAYGPPPAAYGPPQQTATGPEFVAHDRHNSVIVDAAGVALEIQGHTLEFPWSAIATVHFAPGPFATVLMVAVTHAGGMLYECRIAARKQAVLQQWLAELGPVLHHYLANPNRPPAW
ncbi:hypothetical protein J4032_05370 [Streptomyces formicae]|uniref:Uncharacterized protein n=1 Tax=Streptomyces formicae TaxID=1616117 RepID=A0ABY3WUM7_9ACTN|nr:hypothetical protein J4032_05370 [Streptomyces formicae]